MSAEPGIELETLWLESRDLTVSNMAPHVQYKIQNALYKSMTVTLFFLKLDRQDTFFSVVVLISAHKFTITIISKLGHIGSCWVWVWIVCD